jgi:hypothetical protein
MVDIWRKAKVFTDDTLAAVEQQHPSFFAIAAQEEIKLLKKEKSNDAKLEEETKPKRPTTPPISQETMNTIMETFGGINPMAPANRQSTAPADTIHQILSKTTAKITADSIDPVGFDYGDDTEEEDTEAVEHAGKEAAAKETENSLRILTDLQTSNDLNPLTPEQKQQKQLLALLLAQSAQMAPPVRSSFLQFVLAFVPKRLMIARILYKNMKLLFSSCSNACLASTGASSLISHGTPEPNSHTKLLYTAESNDDTDVSATSTTVSQSSEYF